MSDLDKKNTLPEGIRDLAYVTPKITKKEVLEFAAFAIKDPEVVRILQEDIEDIQMSDEEYEIRAAVLTRIRDEYLSGKGKPKRLGAAYSAGYSLIRKCLLGELDSISSPNASNFLHDNATVSYMEDE